MNQRTEVPYRALAATLLLTLMCGLVLKERAMVVRDGHRLRDCVRVQQDYRNQIAFLRVTQHSLSRSDRLLAQAEEMGIAVALVDPGRVFEAPVVIHRREQE